MELTDRQAPGTCAGECAGCRTAALTTTFWGLVVAIPADLLVELDAQPAGHCGLELACRSVFLPTGFGEKEISETFLFCFNFRWVLRQCYVKACFFYISE